MTGRQQEEIEELFRIHADGVGSYIYSRVGNAELAEELTSRVFLTVVRKYEQMRESPAGWIWSIVRTELTQHFRAHKSISVSELAESVQSPNLLPMEQAERKELHKQIQSALERMSEEEQRIVYLKYYQDLPNHEIAEATGLSRSYVGVLVFRTLKRLRTLLERGEFTTPEVKKE